MKILFTGFLIILFYGCKTIEQKLPLVDSKAFKTEISGQHVKLYTLVNKNNLTAQITNLGGRLVSLFVPDKNNNFSDVSLGFKSAKDYLNANEQYYGATIGRYGNRIAKGRFTLNDKTYNLNCNNGINTLHGGPTGFCQRIWDAKQINKSKLELYYTSADGEEGYPGNLVVQVVFQLTDNNELQIEYFANTDKPTPINLTHHSFWNLSGESSGTINNHLLYINANYYTPIDSTLIPTGEIAKVANTPMDFRLPVKIGKRVNNDFEQLKYANGYDHNWILDQNKTRLVHAASLTEPKSGRIMEIYTNEPGLQFYGGNFMNGSDVGKYGKPFKYREALCLETQHFPDSPNHKNFPSTILNTNEQYYSICIYRFKTE